MSSHLALRQPAASGPEALALAELERTFNGPVPAMVRKVARYGSAEMALLARARGEEAFFTAMTRGQIATIRARRRNGSFYPALLTDLAFYRRHRRAWRHLAIFLARRGLPVAATAMDGIGAPNF